MRTCSAGRMTKTPGIFTHVAPVPLYSTRRVNNIIRYRPIEVAFDILDAGRHRRGNQLEEEVLEQIVYLDLIANMVANSCANEVPVLGKNVRCGVHTICMAIDICAWRYHSGSTPQQSSRTRKKPQPGSISNQHSSQPLQVHYTKSSRRLQLILSSGRNILAFGELQKSTIIISSLYFRRFSKNALKRRSYLSSTDQ